MWGIEFQLDILGEISNDGAIRILRVADIASRQCHGKPLPFMRRKYEICVTDMNMYLNLCFS